MNSCNKIKGLKKHFAVCDFLPKEMLKRFLVIFWNTEVSGNNEKHVNAEDFRGLIMEF